jgi:hypothetical protein
MEILPIFKTALQDLQLLQTRWASIINPLLKNPALQSRICKDVALLAGTNQVSHKLGRPLQGWSIVRKNGFGDVYDTQSSNPTADVTLQLVSSAIITVDILVF